MLFGLENAAGKSEKGITVFEQIYYFKICIAQIKTEMVNFRAPNKYHNLGFLHVDSSIFICTVIMKRIKAIL